MSFDFAALQRCQAKIVNGKSTGVGPDDDQKATDNIGTAVQKLKDGIAQACEEAAARRSGFGRCVVRSSAEGTPAYPR